MTPMTGAFDCVALARAMISAYEPFLGAFATSPARFVEATEPAEVGAATVAGLGLLVPR